MPIGDLPNPPSLIKQAVEKRSPVIDIIKQYTDGDAERHRLLTRTWRYLDKNSGGNRLKDLLLKQGVRHRLKASTQLVVPAAKDDEEDPVLNLIADAGIPILSITQTDTEDRASYSYWYTRLKRMRPEAMKYVKSKDAPDLSLDNAELLSDQSTADNYFQFTDHELT